MQIHTTFVTNLREGLSRGSPKENNETKRNENRDDLQNVPRKLSTVCLLFCYGLFEVSILRSLDTRRFLKCRMTVSYFGFIFSVIIESE